LLGCVLGFAALTFIAPTHAAVKESRGARWLVRDVAISSEQFSYSAFEKMCHDVLGETVDLDFVQLRVCGNDPVGLPLSKPMPPWTYYLSVEALLQHDHLGSKRDGRDDRDSIRRGTPIPGD
jgi:hypothetical protein